MLLYNYVIYKVQEKTGSTLIGFYCSFAIIYRSLDIIYRMILLISSILSHKESVIRVAGLQCVCQL